MNKQVGIWIRSQYGHRIVFTDCVMTYLATKRTPATYESWAIDSGSTDDDIRLGEYPTEARALEVMDLINSEINGIMTGQLQNTVFQIPRK